MRVLIGLALLVAAHTTALGQVSYTIGTTQRQVAPPAEYYQARRGNILAPGPARPAPTQRYGFAPPPTARASLDRTTRAPISKKAVGYYQESRRLMYGGGEAKSFNDIENPVRRIDGNIVFLWKLASDGQAIPRWTKIHGKVLNVLPDGVLLSSDTKVYKITGLPYRPVDDESVSGWFYLTGGRYEYTAVSGSKKTVRVLAYGQVVPIEEALEAIRNPAPPTDSPPRGEATSGDITSLVVNP